MKTKNNTTNKNNRLENVLSKSAAVIVSFVLISFTVSAQGFWKQLLTNNSFGKMALLMVEQPAVDLSTDSGKTNTTAPVETESSTFFIDPAADKTLELQSWMTDDVLFGAFTYILKPEIENGLELETWMTDNSHFSRRFAVDPEDELKLEAWMTDDAYWRR